jgi:PST family polysaccharide transporter
MNFRNLLSGTSAMAAASVLRVAVQIIILPIIGRLLGPTAYGQIALVSPFIFFAMLLSESGLGAFIIRAKELSPELEGTVFCFSASFSLLLMVLFIAIAYPIGQLIHEPTFPPLLIGMSSILLMSSFNIVPAAILLRNHRYGWIAFSDLVSSIGSVVAVTAAIMLGCGVWSLVIQQIILWLCKIVVVTIGSQWRPRFTFHWEIVKPFVSFGSNLTGASIVQFIARNIDNILIGTLLGTETLGYYSLAWQINTLPATILSGSVYYTVFSTTSKMHRLGTFTSEPFLKTLKGVLLISAPVMIGLAVTAPLSISLIVGDRWLPSVAIIRCMATMGLCQTIGAAVSGLLIGLGLAAASLRLSIINSLATIVAIIIGVFINSQTVAAGISIAAVIGLYTTLRVVTKSCMIDSRDILKILFPPITAALLMGIFVYTTQSLILLTEPTIIRLIASIALGITSYSFLLFTLFNKQFAENIKDLKIIMNTDLASRRDVS